MTKISCIIPAYNEGKRIRTVLEVATAHPLIDEVVVVDDGSADDTREITSEFEKIRLIVHKKNQGKSIALYDGIKASTGTFVFFLDADLVGLVAQNITDLITPVRSGVADVSMSLRRNAPGLWHYIGIDYISGERVLPKSIVVPHLDQIVSLSRFGFEVFLNRLIIKNNCRVKIVNWPNVDSPYKATKVGFWEGIRGEIYMLLDIFKTISLFGPLYQIFKLKKLMIK
jgi:glycosyltransferase involved in cell wall biosynthesis